MVWHQFVLRGGQWGGYTQSDSICRDRKRKRFVGGETEAKKKKIKTESGHWIDATYKSGVYPLFP